MIKTVLIDDEKIAIERLKILLNGFQNIKVIGEYSCPETAKKEIIAKNPDLAFVDVEMPKMSGLELVRAIKAVGVKCKIVFVTSYGHYAIKAIREAAFDYLLKPVDVEELSQVIERFVNESNTPDARLENIVQEFELSARETDVLKLQLKGAKSNEIAETLCLSKHTINTHRKNILEKLNVRSAQEMLIRYFN